MALLKRRNQKKQNNQGAAMVMVIVAIAFIGMLVAMILYMSYANYIMKANDRRAKDNFYTAESALDIINAGLQKDISDCMADAYVKAMQYSSDQEADVMTNNYKNYYMAKLVSTEYLLETATSDPDSRKYSLQHLKDMWNGVIDIASAAYEKGAYLEANGDNKLLVEANNNSITLCNLRIVYTDDNGFVSIIDTDVRIKTPSIDFAAASGKMNIENYSLIAQNSLISDSQNLNATGQSANITSTDITGNVFGGYNGIVLANQNRMSFKIDDRDSVRSLDAKGDPIPVYNLAADSINVDNVSDATKIFSVDDAYKTYVEDINVNSSVLEMDGEIFVSDDLNISGKRSDVTLKGKYYGYGNKKNNPLDSSAILINGGDTDLDMSGLDELMLSGRAYVGATKYDADADRQLSIYKASLSGNTINSINIDALTTDNIGSDKIDSGFIFNTSSGEQNVDVDVDYNDYDEAASSYNEAIKVFNEALDIQLKSEEVKNDPEKIKEIEALRKRYIPKNDTDIMTGESMAVKVNQLMYMVPSECIGYIEGTDKQVVGKNPMTYEEYQMLLNDKVTVKLPNGESSDEVEKSYEVVSALKLNQFWDKLGGYQYCGANGYQAVYRRINGTVMVYLYFHFESDTKANEFYKAWCEYDPQGVSSYVSSYVNSISWPANMKGSNEKLSLAGNAFDYNTRTKEITLVDSNKDNDEVKAKLKTAKKDYSSRYYALMRSTSDDYTTLGSKKSHKIFDNYVNLGDLMSCEGVYETINPADNSVTAAAQLVYFTQEEIDSGNAIVEYPSGCANGTSTHVIVTNGSVKLSADYDGLILARENIYLGTGCSSVRYNPELCVNSLKSLKRGTTDKYAFEVFGESGKITYGQLVAGSGVANEDERAFNLVDLITYEHWKKD